MILHELEAEQVLNRHTIDLFGPTPRELVEGFNDRETGVLDASDASFVPALVEFALGQSAEIIDVT